jgi:hypothetical protein
MDQYVDRERLAEGVREWIERSDEVGQDLQAIVIMHEGSGDPVDTITAAQIPKNPKPNESTEKVDALIEKIAKKIENDARGWDGTHQQYFVEARLTGHRATSRLTFGIAMKEKGRKGGRTETADDKGERQMLMRLLDNVVTKVMDRHDRIENRSDLRLDKSQAREDALRYQVSALQAALDDSLTAKEERIAAAETRKEDSAMKRELFRDVKGLIPTVVNRMTGGQILPEAELAPEQKMLRVMVRDLDGPEMESFLRMLEATKPRLALMLAELVLSVQGEDARRSSLADAAQGVVDRAKAPPPTGQPEPKAVTS